MGESSAEHVRANGERARMRAAFALGLCVAILGTIVALASFDRAPAPRGPTATLPDIPYLWPENWARPGDDIPTDVQAKVDAGAKSLQWRLDPEEVARRFAQQVLGYDAVTLDERHLGAGGVGHVYEVISCPDLGGAVACPMIAFQQYVWVRQPGRTGDRGIWAVTGANADTLDVGFGTYAPDTETVPAGSTLHMDLGVPPDQTVIVGFHAHSDGCSFGTTSQQGAAPGLGDGPFDLAIAAPKLGLFASEGQCAEPAAAYAYAYTVPAVNMPTGDPFLEAGDVVAVTAWPFVFDPAGDASSSAPTTHEPVASVTVACDDTSARIVGSDTAIAQADGVHVTLANETQGPMSVSFERAGTGDGGSPGDTAFVVDPPPGVERVTCSTASRTIGSVSFTIVDPNGLYVHAEGTCSAAPAKKGDAWQPTAAQLAVDPTLADATDYLHRVVGPGEVVLSGYPEFRDQRTYALLQHGNAVGWVSYFPSGDGWVWDSYSACTGNGGMVSGTS